MAELGIDYTSKDYQSLVDQADSFLASLVPEWTNRDDNDINWATVKTCAFLVSIGMFYIDLAFNEQDPYEVQIYEHALRLAKKYGYIPSKFIGSTTELVVTVNDHVSTLIIPRGTYFMSGSDKYVLLDDAIYPVGTNQLNLDVQYGEWERYKIGISNGGSFQKFIVNKANVQDLSVRCFIKEGVEFEEWEAQDSLIMSVSDDKHFRLLLNEDQNYEIHFGDNLSGKIPISNSEIYVEIIKMPDNYLNKNYGILPLNNINSSSSSDVVTVLQDEDATGGGPRETIETISRNLPQWISTANRVVAPNDAIYLARKVPGVSDVQLNIDGMTYNLYVIPIGGGAASTTLRNRVYDYLSVRAIPQININILLPVPIGITLAVSITVEDNFNQSEVYSLTVDALTDFLDKPTEVGRVVGLQDAYAILDGIDGIRKSKITALYLTGLDPSIDNIELAYNQVSSVGSLVVTPSGGIV